MIAFIDKSHPKHLWRKPAWKAVVFAAPSLTRSPLPLKFFNTVIVLGAGNLPAVHRQPTCLCHQSNLNGSLAKTRLGDTNTPTPNTSPPVFAGNAARRCPGPCRVAWILSYLPAHWTNTRVLNPSKIYSGDPKQTGLTTHPVISQSTKRFPKKVKRLQFFIWQLVTENLILMIPLVSDCVHSFVQYVESNQGSGVWNN